MGASDSYSEACYCVVHFINDWSLTMKLKYAALVLATTAVLSTTAYANTETFSESDVQALFDGGANSTMQLATLSDQEMKETEGAFGPVGALIGGVGGLTEYALETAISGSEWSWTGAATTTLAGAGAGFAAGPVGLVWGFNTAVATATLRGVAQRNGW